jgi:hypothetical protein
MAWHNFEGNRKHVKNLVVDDWEELSDDDFALAASRRIASLSKSPTKSAWRSEQDSKNLRRTSPRLTDGWRYPSNASYDNGSAGDRQK